MNRAERLQAHQVPGMWMPNPEAHLQSVRDAKHFHWTLEQLHDLPGTSILDVGCYDGWLDFLLIDKGFKPNGVELIPELARSAAAYANAYKLDYLVFQGFFDQIELTGFQYDVALCYEALEHIPLEMVPVYIERMERRTTKRILISLPDQRHEDNAQHLWTPSLELIIGLWGKRKGFNIETVVYKGTDIPPNFLIRWDL